MDVIASYATHNIGLLAFGAVTGAVVSLIQDVDITPNSRYPPALSTNLELISALNSLEDVLPSAQLMGRLVLLSEQLCRLEFDKRLCRMYRALELSHLIKAELAGFRKIPWLVEDMDEFEANITRAVGNIISNIHHDIESM